MKIVIVSNKDWHRRYVDEVAARTGGEVVYIAGKSEVNYQNFASIQPDWVFFPHWSYMIPADVYENFRCVVFHMTDLPFGRGGSPLQNLIVRGYTDTKLSAIRCVGELDAGDIYLKRDLSLLGSAEEIFLRAADLMLEMMAEIIQKDIVPVPQKGEAVIFKRRKPEDGDISGLESLPDVFNYIRMLDAEGYPRAFLNIGRLHIEFDRASLKDGHIVADARISMRDDT